MAHGWTASAGQNKSSAKHPAEPPESPEGSAGYGYTDDPEVLLIAMMNDTGLDARVRGDFAKALMPFKHQKLGEGGKKEQKQGAAATVAKGSKFGASAAPLRAVK